jgi:hypothetical protein
MGHFLGIALSFPAVVYTVALGVALIYWLFVIVGAAHVNLLGEGAADGAMDGALDGAAKGALEGATKGMLEGAADHAAGGDGHHGHDLDVDADGEGGLGGLMAALKLRSAPATVVMSVLILFSWFLVVAAMQVMEALALTGTTATLFKLAVLIFTPIISLIPTSIAVRPLARAFTPPVAQKHAGLVGKMCTIRTGTVNERFGEATLEDGGAGVVVRVRIDTGQKLGRGDQAVIVGYDPEKQEFTVAPMEGLLDDDDDDDHAAKGKRAARR